MQSAQSSGGEVIRVLVADDTQIHTQLLEDALRRDRELEVISSPARSRDLVEVVRLHKVDVVVLSSNLDAEPLRGFEILRQLRASDPGIQVVILLDSSRREAVLQAFRAGAKGIFNRDDSVETLSKCIRSVRQGQIWANSQQMSFAVEALAAAPTVHAVDSSGLSLLSKREMDVVRSLAEGLTNREIAERLKLSQHTIKNYLFRVYDKLGVSSRLELLFMTLTQPGSSNSMAQMLPGTAINKAGDQTAPHRGHTNLRPTKQNDETREVKPRANTSSIATDPLD
jgi:DNA-binding NarL/FixJ family response regulator